MTSARVDFDVPATMRDGTLLYADVYRPVGDGPWPVLVVRTPYGKQFAGYHLLAPVRRGYIVVVQDVRGRFASEGEWEPLTHEHDDGYDTVRWAADLPGSSGAVGMFGGSYLGNTQWMAAIAKPPELTAIAPAITWSEPTDGVFARGGAVELGLTASWSLLQGIDLTVRRWRHDPAQLAVRLRGLVADVDGLAASTYWELPVGDLPVVSRHDLPGRAFVRAARQPDVADTCRVAGRQADTDVAAFHIGGWYDVFGQGTLDNYVALAEAGRPTRLVMGPWSHGAPLGHQVGEVNFGFAAGGQLLDVTAPLMDMQLDWFDRRLKGVTSPRDVPPVLIFVMGVNRWRTEEAWPLARAVDTAYHLGAGGRLSTEPPAADEPPDTYAFDPADPVPTHGGALLMSSEYGPGPRDQQRVEARPDVLVYTTEPLPEDVEVTGRVRAVLHAATDGPSTDWVARLCDVDDAGVSRNVVDGIVRVESRPDETGEHVVDLWSTSTVFLAGHCIRVQVTSSGFPRGDRNPKTGEPTETATSMRVARQTVHHDALRPSRIVLPVVPA